MFTSDELFVRRYDELTTGLSARDPYEAINLGAVLRQLLLDGTPLVNEANRHHKIRIRFVVNDVGDISDIPVIPDVVNYAHGLDPEFIRTHSGRRELKLDDFLRQHVIQTPEISIYVRDIIRFSANKYGGIHFDTSRTEEEDLIDAVFAKIRELGIEPVASMLAVIANITRSALGPLRAAIVKIPSEIPLIAHYKLASGGSSLHFAGKGQFMETNNMNYDFAGGFSWNAIIKLSEIRRNSQHFIYEIGNHAKKFPSLALVVDHKGNLSAVAQLSQGKHLRTTAMNIRNSIFFDRFCFIAFQLSILDGRALLELFLNNDLVDSMNLKFVDKVGHMSRHTIGASLQGSKFGRFDIKELVLASKKLTTEERAMLANYFWLEHRG